MTIELNEKQNKNEIKKQEFDKKIAIEEQKLKLLDQLQNDFENINKSMTRCIDLMSNAVQGEKEKALYDDLYHQNNKLYKDSKNLFENDSLELDLEISKHLYEKSKLEENKKEEK